MKTYQEILERVRFYETRKSRLKSGSYQYKDDFSWSLDIKRVDTAIETLIWIKTLFETYKPRWEDYTKSKGGKFGRRKSDNIFYYIPELQAEIKSTVEKKEALLKVPDHSRDKAWKSEEALIRAREDVFQWLYQDYFGGNPDHLNPTKFLRRWTDQLAEVPEFDVWSTTRKRD